MAQNATTLALQVSERARDPNQTGTASADVISLLSYSQQVVNGVLDDVTDSVPLVLVPRQVIYPIFQNFPSTVKILAVRDASGRDLVPFPDWYGLQQVATNWPSATSSAPRSYAICGRDLLIIYPGVLEAQTLTVIYTKLTTVLTSSSTTEVTNDDDNAAQDLAELLLLLKARDIPDCKKVIERFKARIEAIAGEER